MLYAAVIVSTIGLVCCIVGSWVFAARLFRQSADAAQQLIVAHDHTLSTLERVHNRNMEQVSEVLDRFMSLDFQLFKAYQGPEDVVGGFEEPEEPMRLVDRNGAVVGADADRRVHEELNEQRILAEDFPA